MAKKRRRRIHSMRDLVMDMADDVKDIVKTEFESTKRDDDKGPRPRSAAQAEADRRERERSEEIDELKDIIRALTVKVTALDADKQ